KLHPKDAALRHALARTELRAGRPGGAVELLAPSLKDLPADPVRLWELGGLLLEAGKTSELEEILRRLQAAGHHWAAGLLSGRRAMRKKEWGEARVTLEGVRDSRLPNAEVRRAVYLLLAECYAAQGNPDQQAAAAKAALSGDDANPAARAWLASAYAALGQTTQALGEYGRLGRAGAPERARLLLLRELTKPKAERSWGDVERALAEVPEARRRRPDLLRLRADLLLAQGKEADARQLLKAECRRDPKQVLPWLLLAGLARRQGADKVLPVLAEAERQAGPKGEWPVARARHWAQVGGEAGKKQLQALAGQLDTWKGDDRDRLAAALAEGFLLVHDSPAALRLWRELARRRPADLPVRLTLLEAAARAGREDEVRGLAAEIATLEGEKGPFGAYAEVLLGLVRARAGKRD